MRMMASLGNRNGIKFSPCLRIYLLLLLGLIVLELECEAIPVAETDGPIGIFVQTDDLVTNQEGQARKNLPKGKKLRRTRRYYSHWASGDRSKVEIGIGTWVDGKTCITGQDPLDKTEAEVARATFIKQLKGLQEGYTKLFTKRQWHVHSKALENAGAKNCASKVCNFDLARMSLICGPLPPQNFEDGKSCIDGSTPKTAEEFKKTSAYKEFGLDGGTLLTQTIDEANMEAQDWYGKDCKMGKCYYHFYRGNYICGLKEELPTSTTTTKAEATKNASSRFKSIAFLFTFLTTSSCLSTFIR